MIKHSFFAMAFIASLSFSAIHCNFNNTGNLNMRNFYMSGKMISKAGQINVREDFELNGYIEGVNIKVGGKMTATEGMNVSDSIFNEVQTDSGSSFTRTKINSLSIVTSGKTFSQEVTLTDNTIVEGDITFTAPGGIVHCDATSQVKGKIINGSFEGAMPAQDEAVLRTLMDLDEATLKKVLEEKQKENK